MYKIKFFTNAQGEQPIKLYLKELGQNTDKDSRTKLKKIHEYMEALKTYGTRAGYPYVKHIDGDIWELRPLKDRFFFFFWHDGIFVFLHHCVKKTKKTPASEIKQAKRNLKDFIERSGNNNEQ
jgi:phage-related protein